jgi:hypothetical protein
MTSSCLCFQLGTDSTTLPVHDPCVTTDYTGMSIWWLGYHGHNLSAATCHGVPPISPHLGPDAQVIRKGAFIGLFLAGVVSANWTDECWHFARCHSQRLKVLSCYSTTYSYTRFRFLLVLFFPPCFLPSPFRIVLLLTVKKRKLRAQPRDSGWRASKVIRLVGSAHLGICRSRLPLWEARFPPAR